MVRSTIDHLGALYQRPVTLVELEQLSALFATANVYSSVHAALEDRAEVAEWVLYMLKVDRLAREVF